MIPLGHQCPSQTAVDQVSWFCIADDSGPGHVPKTAPSPEGEGLPPNTWFLGPSKSTTKLVSQSKHKWTHTHARTHPFNGPLSGTTQVSRYQKGKTNLDFTEARNSEWQWHQLGNMQACTSLQTVNHASTPPLSFLQAGCPSCCPTNSVKALKAKALKAHKRTYSSQYSACLPGWNNNNYIRIITIWHYKYLHCRNVKWCSNSIYRQYDCFVFPVCSNETHQSSSMQ